MWKTYRPSQIRGVTSASDRYSLLLLDGQQRLTSLYVLFEGGAPPFYEGEHLFYNLYFNLQTEEFRFWQKSLMDGNPAWLGVHELLRHGLGVFLRRLPQLPPEQHELATEHLDRIGQLDAIRSYPYTVDLLSQEDLTLDEVIEIFNQVNSAGTPLTKADLGLAHICSVWPEARPELRAFSDEMGQYGFPVGLDFLLRCIAAVASGSLLLEGNFYKVPAEELQLAWKKVRQSVEYIINVLRHEAYVDRLSDLPGPNVLIPLAVYLARNSSAFASEIEKRKFLRWMFLAGIWGRYSGSTETNLQRDISLLNDLDPTGRLVEAIIRERGRIHLEARDLEGRGAGTPVYKFSEGVRDASSGGDPVQPAAEADQRRGGPVDIPDPVQQAPPARSAQALARCPIDCSTSARSPACRRLNARCPSLGRSLVRRSPTGACQCPRVLAMPRNPRSSRLATPLASSTSRSPDSSTSSCSWQHPGQPPSHHSRSPQMVLTARPWAVWAWRLAS